MLLRIHSNPDPQTEPIVVTGIGLITSNGRHREEAWKATRQGISGIRSVEGRPGIPEHLKIAASVDVEPEYVGQLKSIQLARIAADEAMRDAKVDLEAVDRDRFACSVSSQFGDISWWNREVAPEHEAAHHRLSSEQWLPSSSCWDIAHRYGLNGPRVCHATACASGLVDILTTVRSIRDGLCDIALAGSAEYIHPLCAAGFDRMRVLAKDADTSRSCMPFDTHRHGFVMGEGAGMLVIERLSHAVARGATIYAEIVGGKMLADAHHVTSLNEQSDVLERLIGDTIRAADIEPADVGYINAHGTGTKQNDVIESRGIRNAFGRSADDVCVSSMKSMLGHLVNASGSVELALTLMGMRDGVAPPTVNLHAPDPQCDLDFVPIQSRTSQYQHALKLSLAFGGHLVAAIVRRWNDVDTGFAYPEEPLRKAA